MKNKNSIGFGNFREFSNKLATNSANINGVFHLLKTFAKFGQNNIKIEHDNCRRCCKTNYEFNHTN